jgi:hypothetical protein
MKFSQSLPQAGGNVIVGKVLTDGSWDYKFPMINCVNQEQAKDFLKLLNFAYQAGRDDLNQEMLYSH